MTKSQSYEAEKIVESLIKDIEMAIATKELLLKFLLTTNLQQAPIAAVA